MTVRITGSLLVGLLLLCHTWRAWANVEVNMEDKVEVDLGETAQITCIFTTEEGVGGTMIDWLYVTRTRERQRIYHLDSTMSGADKDTPFADRISVNGSVAPGTSQVVLTIRNVLLEDEVEFICSVRSLTDGDAEGKTKLRVFQTPGPPAIEGVESGISILETTPSKIGTCEVKNGYPKPNITWYKDNTPLRSVRGEVNIEPIITTQSSGLYSVKSELSMKVVKEDANAFFNCEVTYFTPGGTRMIQTSTINITVFYPHTSLKMWVESPKGKIKEGDTVVIRCSGDGNDPFVQFTITAGNETDSSEMIKPNVTRLDSGVYSCSAQDFESLDDITANITVSVNYLDDAVIVPEKNIEVHQGEEVEATCNALSSLSTHTAWFKNGELVSEGHTLLLKDTATFDTAGTYVCVVTVVDVEDMKVSGALQVHIQGPPEIREPLNSELDEYVASTRDLSCLVQGFPVPTVTWSTADGKILQTKSEKETVVGVNSTVSVKVTGDITVFCNATNKFGEESVAFHIKAISHTTPATTDSPVSHTTPATTDSPVKAETAIPPKKVKKEGSGVIIAVIIICILLLAILGSVLYFLYKKGIICGRSGKQDLTKGKSNKDNIVVEMKSDNTEEAVLLSVNGEKQPPNDQ